MGFLSQSIFINVNYKTSGLAHVPICTYYSTFKIKEFTIALS
jgi:hypothetical protein